MTGEREGDILRNTPWGRFLAWEKKSKRTSGKEEQKTAAAAAAAGSFFSKVLKANRPRNDGVSILKDRLFIAGFSCWVEGEWEIGNTLRAVLGFCFNFLGVIEGNQNCAGASTL